MEESEKEYEQYCVLSPEGHLTNHHRLPDGKLGERVKKEEATWVVATNVKVKKL